LILDLAIDRRKPVLLFLLAFVTYAWFFGGAGWNQDAHFDLTRALVERGTLHIDGYAVNTGDVSTGVDGHTYINKPPGVSFLAAVPYFFVYRFEKWRGMPVDALTYPNQWIVTALTNGICGALIGVVLFLYGRRLGVSDRSAMLVALLILFGTIIFTYSTMLFTHVASALFLLVAFTEFHDRPFVSGMAAGAATTCFYVCGVTPLIFLAVCRSWRSAGRFVLGGIPFAIALGVYHALCFGSPFRTSVELSKPFTEQGLLFGVLRMPRLEALHDITFAEYRGLFFASPVLLFAFAGLAIMFRRGLVREASAILAAFLAFVLVNAGFNGWSGGWNFGPRYLVPVIPLLGIPMFFATHLWRPLWVLLGAVSIAIHFIATAVDPMPSPEQRHPVRAYLATGLNDVALARESRNLGEPVFGRQTRSSIMPVLLWMIGGSLLLLRRPPQASRRNQ
jgi:hypothetical protein